jgi:hypothetical protein
MAFVNYVLNNPGYSGIEDPEEVYVKWPPVNPAELEIVVGGFMRKGGMQVLASPTFNTNNEALTGWQTFGGGGGGGPTRPTSGFLYPRGQG